METVEYKNISFTVWDVGGQDKVWITKILFSDICSSNFLLCYFCSSNDTCFFHRFVHCGGTISKTLRVSFSSWTVMTGTVLLRQEMSYTGC